MNNKPTPETDAQITTFDSISKYKKRFKNKTGTVSLDFARRLERERDLAREETRIAVGLLSTHPQFAKFHPEKVLEMVKLEAAK